MKNAGVFVTAILFSAVHFCGHSARATATTSSTLGSIPLTLVHDVRSVREVQNEIEELMVSDERAKALSVLANRLKYEKRESVRLELRKLQDRTSETFLAEKALQAYELGRSLVFSDVPGAVTKFTEALQVEPENLAILSAQARARLQLGECALTLKETAAGLKVNENYRPLLLIELQTLVCLQKTNEAEKLISEKLSDAGGSLVVQLSKAQLAMIEKDYEMAFSSIEKAKAADAQMPEVYYWEAQVAEQRKKESLDFYRRYLELCTEPTRDRRHQYELEPRTCGEAKAIERLIEARTGKLKG